MAEKNEISGMLVNSGVMKDIQLNNTMINTAQQIVENLNLNVINDYINSTAYKNILASVSSLQTILDQMKPTVLDIPVYNKNELSAIQQNTGILTALSTTAVSIKKILPDMSVISSLAKTISVLSGVFESASKAYDVMQPLWNSGCIRAINSKAVWTCIKNEEIRDAVIEEDEIVKDIEVLCVSDNPKHSMNEFASKWKKKISGMVFSTITWIGITICSGGIQYMFQPLYQEVLPQISSTENQCKEEILSEKEMEFAIFCIENIALELGRSGDEVYRLLAVDSDILDDYIIANYEALHTQGREYIVRDIMEYMKERGLIE